MSVHLPILLLPGMAADERLFESQLARFPHLQVPKWISPFPNESLRDYAIRFAKTLDPGCLCIIGGASFGGIVALEMASSLPAIACVLIGSIRSPKELPWSWRIFKPLARLGPNRLGHLARWSSRIGSSVLNRGAIRRLQKLSRSDAEFVRWAMCAVLRWTPSTIFRKVKVFQIHGSSDRILPVKRTTPDVIVRGGAHALSLFNPKAVNAFLEKVLAWSRTREPNNF